MQEDGKKVWAYDHRVALSMIAALSVVMLAFGLLSIANTVKKPFEPKTAGTFKTLEQQEKEQEAALKVRDTDGDGLSDYDELHIFHTSAFLADTDSDGAADGVEVKKGTDPNCPEGKTCSGASYYAAPPAQADPNTVLMQGANPFLQVLDASIIGGGSFDVAVLQKFDAARIRELLKAAGVPDSELSKVSDKQLEEVYTQTMREQVASSSLDRVLQQLPDTSVNSENN